MAEREGKVTVTNEKRCDGIFGKRNENNALHKYMGSIGRLLW
jgi:hypothetical protein